MRALENLEPKKVFYYFEEICRIPHGSGNLDAISAYLEKFAKDRGLFCVRDEANNVIIIKEATDGYEGAEPVMLQGHMDMVAVKDDGCDIDLEKDALRLRTKGDDIYAQGTSLGGDDGIAVAYMLALLDSDDIPHPRIEAVMTTDEEVGMGGAIAIDLSMLKAKRMINIDSEEEGVLLTSCAGGMRTDCHLPVKLINRPDNAAYVDVDVCGLKGGHSGTEINKERGNAIKLLGVVLCHLMEKFDFNLADICGGEKDNAIPIFARATLCIPAGIQSGFDNEIGKIAIELANEYKSKEKDLAIIASLRQMDEERVFDEESTKRIAAFLMTMPNGVMAMSADIEGLVETSLNAGVLRYARGEENEAIVSFALRSSIDTAKLKLRLQLDTLAKCLGGYTKSRGEYTGWQFNPDSKLRADMVRIYKRMFGKDVKLEALHAGLECGVMISKIPGLDCVSCGPNIYDIHTAKERLSISSVKRMWDYLLEVLKEPSEDNL